MIGLISFGFLPLIYAIVYYFGDVWTYLRADKDDESLEEVEFWQVHLDKQITH